MRESWFTVDLIDALATRRTHGRMLLRPLAFADRTIVILSNKNDLDASRLYQGVTEALKAR
jgi:hypothetical protein